jgi:hypothetical protein
MDSDTTTQFAVALQTWYEKYGGIPKGQQLSYVIVEDRLKGVSALAKKNGETCEFPCGCILVEDEVRLALVLMLRDFRHDEKTWRNYGKSLDTVVERVILSEGDAGWTVMALRTNINISEFPPRLVFPRGTVFVAAEREL